MAKAPNAQPTASASSSKAPQRSSSRLKDAEDNTKKRKRDAKEGVDQEDQEEDADEQVTEEDEGEEYQGEDTDSEAPIPNPKNPARRNYAGKDHPLGSEEEGNKAEDVAEEAYLIQEANDAEWQGLLKLVSKTNAAIRGLQDKAFYDALSESELLGFFTGQTFSKLDTFLHTYKIPSGRFYTKKIRKAHRCTQAVMALRYHLHKNTSAPKPWKKRKLKTAPPPPELPGKGAAKNTKKIPQYSPSMKTAGPNSPVSETFRSFRDHVPTPGPPKKMKTPSPDPGPPDFNVEKMNRNSWPDRYSYREECVPLWAHEWYSVEKDVEKFISDSVRGCVNHYDHAERILRLRSWGRLGWQNGKINRLRSEMDQRQIQWQENEAGQRRCLDLKDNLLNKKKIPGGRRYFRRSSRGDEHGKVDEEAWEITLMLLVYELEAAVQRFGGRLMEAIDDRIELIRARLHEDDGGIEGNKEDFFDPGVGPGYTRIRRARSKPT